MTSSWYSLLFRPAESATAVTQDDESPVLVLVPVLAGIGIAFGWAASFHGLMAPATRLVFPLLVGPPLVLLASWWGRLCLTGACRLLGGRPAKGILISIIAWSWLPLLYLSLPAAIFSRLDKAGQVLIILLLIGMVWQLAIIGAILRRILSFSLLRTVSLLLLSLLLFLVTTSAAGFVLALPTRDWFRLAGAL
jgi:TM2 domain-containing membrane protein YozV